MDDGTFLVVAFVAGLLFGLINAYIASAKGRGSGEGFLLGAFLGPFGLLIEVLLPTITRRADASSATAQNVAAHPTGTVAFCTECGSALGPDVRFCGACGQPVPSP